jgi:hypothetical protein
MDQSLFDKLAEEYGIYSSWAIWNPANPEDTGIIAEHLPCLKTSVVMVGLNISRPIPIRWQNFHGRDHARKLMFAFNESPYRGAYCRLTLMTFACRKLKPLGRFRIGTPSML